ncbi:MAG: ABC transporter substrate-binding protein [Phycisphaeraceae bacterium]|nr:ABC transporter substrate-binding protein [Phycisphaeraceae bacterium]
MWFPLANFTGPDGTRYRPRIDTRGYEFVHVLEDIQSLNQRSERGELEITALSIHQYPFVADKYVLTACGSSMGDGYGPMVVAKDGPRKNALGKAEGWEKGLKLAIPGRRTTAWLAMQLWWKEQGVEAANVDVEVVPFDQILEVVAEGKFDAGLIIHEGQLTYRQQGLACVEDLGAWWTRTRGLPLPLGGNAIRRDLGEAAIKEICGVLLESIRYALAHRQEAVMFALQWARGMDGGLADEFVGMYVNDWTLDYGPRGRQAIERLVREGIEAGLVPDRGRVGIVSG